MGEVEIGSGSIPDGRYQRLAQVGRVAGAEAAKRAGTHAVNLMRSEDRAALALGRRHLETAERLVSVLGAMKGAAMKLGQILSVVDAGFVPDAYREEFQRTLAALRDSAPAVPFEHMSKAIETEFGRSLAEIFTDFDPQPIGAASIGQVYRAELRNGRKVAVKVQYPGVGAAVRADMRNLELLLPLLHLLAPQLDVKTLHAEIRGEVFEELDYEREATNQRILARIYRGHPFVFVPDVITELSGKRVIVTEFVEGDSFAVLERESEVERNRVGEIVLRFYFGSMYRHRKFSGDPHPGNVLRRPDGTIAFLDFGLFKHIAREPIEANLEVLRAMSEGKEAEFHRLLAGNGFLPEPSRFDPDELMAYLSEAYWWCTTADHDLEITPEFAEGMTAFLRPGTQQFELTRRLDLNPEHLLGRRVEVIVLAVLGRLRATANWHRISREWIYGDPPTTELGREEAAFLRR